MKKLCPFLMLFLIVFISCDSKKIYEKYFDNERITWNRFDEKTFQFEIEDISATYDFYIAIRHHTEVPFKYISTKFTLYTPSGEVRMLEQKIILKDNDGKLLGEGMGDLWDVIRPVREDFEFTEPGICRVEISSTMPQADLPGIMQVGLVVRKRR
jgi:gliding motility-associated lipoprotein GldH